MDGLYLLGFGPRAPAAARELMANLYPDLAGPARRAPTDDGRAADRRTDARAGREQAGQRRPASSSPSPPWLLGGGRFLSLSIGSTGITLTALPRVLAADAHRQRRRRRVAREQLVLIDIRLPRLLLGIFVGAALAVSGAMMQGMFRNPLADPSLVGVSSGAALAAVATIALGNGLAAPWIKAFGVYALPCPAFCGGIATTSSC